MAGTLPNQGGSRDIDQKGQGQVWLRSVDEVNSEIDFVLKYLLNLNKRFKSQRNCGNLYETNKLLSDWNEELLLFCKTNRKKYMIDDKTSRMDKKLLEYETMLGQNQKRVDELKKELTEAIKAKDIALNRLSEIQSRLLKMNNPEITDLSDENRPTVLGEKLKRVYEDEWTDAFEFLTEKREEKLSEEQAIDILYSLLKKCHELGAEALRGQHVRLARIVNDPAYLKFQVEKCLNESEQNSEECLNESQPKPEKNVAKEAKKLNMKPQPSQQMNNNPKQLQFSRTMSPGIAQKVEQPQANKDLGRSVLVNNKNQHPLVKQNQTSQATLGRSDTRETQERPTPKMSSEAPSTSRTSGDQSKGDNSVAQLVQQYSGAQKGNELPGAQTEKQLPGTQTVNQWTGTQTVSQRTGTQTVNQWTGTQTVSQRTGTQTVSQRTGAQTEKQLPGTQTVNQWTGTQTVNQWTGTLTVSQRTGAQTLNQRTGAQTEKQLPVNQSAETPQATQSQRDQMSNSTAKASAAMTTTQAQKLKGSEKHDHLPDIYDARETDDTTKHTTVDQQVYRKLEMPIREFSKIVAKEVLANLKIHDILPAMKKTQEFPGDIFNNEFVVKYIEECFQLCWLMQVQCPPMLMDFDTKPGSAFDANFFDIYTNRGPKITMVVWPPVHLHKGGPLVSKGYAECAK